jgi:pheromone shutdown protein TraB
LKEVIVTSFRDKSIKTFGMGLLVWMQLKAAKVMGSKLGAELTIAASEAIRLNSKIILGDRLYSVTIQRIFDKLSFVEKIKLVFIMMYEVLTLSFFKIKDYIYQSENNESFIKDEIKRFTKHLPSLANVIIYERDEYLSQSICELAKVGFGRIPDDILNQKFSGKKGRIVVVVGAGHLNGIQKYLQQGGVGIERIQEISASTKHNFTWPGSGVLSVYDPSFYKKN